MVKEQPQRMLSRELDDITHRHARLVDDQAFVVWFLQAFAGATEQQALDSLPGRSGDKGIDGIFIDSHLRVAYLIQAKLRQRLGVGAETRNDVLGFAGLAETVAGDHQGFKTYLGEMDPRGSELIKEARQRVLRYGYSLDLCYATTGRCSERLRVEATRKVRAVRLPSGQRARFSMFDAIPVTQLLREWLEGAAPPIPSLELPIDGDEIRRSDDKTGIGLRVFWMNGYHVADLYRRAEVRIFHRNVRGYLGLASSEINLDMFRTLQDEGQNFIYLNNGVTIVCDGITPEETPGGKRVMIASNPQIINGQQTTRVLAEAGDRAKRASVLMRILIVPRGGKVDEGAYDRIVSQVVTATNHQNAIKPSDLRSNDRTQVYLDRELRKLNYHYGRKRQTKREIRRQASTSHFIVTKQELAQAVAASLEEGLPRRVGRERLFENPLYERIFASEDVYYYLSRYRLFRLVNSGARGSAERQWAKFVVHYFVWQSVRTDIRKKQRAFVAAMEQPTRHPEIASPITDAIDIAFRIASDYYRRRRGGGLDRVDLATFFKRRDVYAGFERFWRSRQNPAGRRQRFRDATREFGRGLTKA